MAPVLLVRGAPVLLVLRAARRDGAPREWLVALLRSHACRLLTHPAVAFALLVGTLVALLLGFTALAVTVLTAVLANSMNKRPPTSV